jgi:predicted dehydrogenase
MTAARYIAKPDWYSSFDVDPRTATGAPLRWGVVATGGIARKVTSELARLEDVVLHAVSSRTAEKAAAFAAEHGFDRWYADDDASSGAPGSGGTGAAGSQAITGYAQLMRDPDVDVVYVATPHGQHYEVVKAALEAGKHVLCEKAFTINAREATELIDLARDRNLFLMEAVWARFVPGMQRVFDIVQDGELGPVQWVRADLGFPAPMDPQARIWAPVNGGGALLDLTVYPLLWAWGALGAPSSVSASGTLTDFGVDSQNSLTLSYASGAHAQLLSSLTARGPRTAVVAGSRGYLEATGSINNPTELRVFIGENEPRVEHFSPVGAGYTYQLREVTRCIQEGRTESPTMPLSDTLAMMHLFDGVRAELGIIYPQDSLESKAKQGA